MNMEMVQRHDTDSFSSEDFEPASSSEMFISARTHFSDEDGGASLGSSPQLFESARTHFSDDDGLPSIINNLEIEEIGESSSWEPAIPAPFTEEEIEGESRIHNPSSVPLPLLGLLAVIGGLTIGYELNVTGGVLSMPVFLNALMPNIYLAKVHARTNNFCPYVNYLFLTFASAIPLCASISIWLGLIGCYVWGRRRVILWCALALLLIGVTCVTSSTLQIIQITGFVLIGSSVGLLRQVMPTICFEIAPFERRQLLYNLFNYSLFAGNTLATLVNYIASLFPGWGWRVSLALPYICILVMAFISFFIPQQSSIETESLDFRKTHRQLLIRGRRECPILVIINATGKVLPQFTGTDSLVYFGPLLMGSLTDDTMEAFLTPFIVSGIGLIAALVYAFVLLDRFVVGRKRVMLISVATICLSEISLFLIFLHQNPNHHLGYVDAMKAFGFFLVCAIGNSLLTGPHGWITNTYSHETCAIGTVWKDSSSMFMTSVMSMVTINLLCHLRAYAFMFFALCSIMMAVFIYLLVPETTGITSHGIWRHHFFWKRCMIGDDNSNIKSVI